LQGCESPRPPVQQQECILMLVLMKVKTPTRKHKPRKVCIDNRLINAS
jgi:hypothetical protein